MAAAGAGVRPDTLRYYERTGLVPPPPRTTGAHRRYPEATVDRLRFIRGAQDQGMRILVGIVGTLTAIILILPH